jgi:hypothetical protein
MKPKNDWRAYRNSKYLRKEEFPEPEDLTISDVQEEQVAALDEEPEPGLILYFSEKEKGMVCNPTNSETLEKMTGSANPQDWIGTKVTVFNDPTVRFGSKITGGLRLRPPPMMQVRPHKPVPMSQHRADATDDDLEDRMNRDLAAAEAEGY